MVRWAVISDNLSAIRSLASARIGSDITTWRLEDYLNLQSFACLWGVVLSLRRYSDEPFNTSEIIFPRWSEVPMHPPTAVFAALVLAAIGGAAWGAWPRPSVRQRREGTGA